MRLNAKLRDMNSNVPATDERAIEVLASGLELNHGAQLAVDITVQSAVTACGRARPNAAAVDGAVLEEARHQKEVKYELCAGDASSWSASRQEGGGAQRHSRSLSDWQSHVRRPSRTAVLFVSRLEKAVVPDAVRLLQPRFRRDSGVFGDDQLEGTEGIVPELVDLFSAEWFLDLTGPLSCCREKKKKKLFEGGVHPPGILPLGVAQFVELAPVTVACFFLSHDASDLKHIKKKTKKNHSCAT